MLLPRWNDTGTTRKYPRGNEPRPRGPSRARARTRVEHPSSGNCGLRPITGQELCKRREQAGWSLQRIKGSPYIYSKLGERKIISVPVHGAQQIKPGLAGRIARDAKITW